MRAPLTDADVPQFWAELGVPGGVDFHVHFMPERVLSKVWAYFDRMEEHAGVRWEIRYREDQASRVRHLRRMGVVGFTSLVYPHKPDMAEWLNGWARRFAAETPGCIPSATFFPEASADRYVAEALEGGARVFKVHLQVGGFDPRHPLLRPVWTRLQTAQAPIVIHAGSGPEPGPFTGPAPIAEVLEAHPDLVLVVAHMGAPEYDAFARLALRHAGVHLDTAMAFTDFVGAFSRYPPSWAERLAQHPEKVLLGTDYPNIPHAYAHQLAALVEAGFERNWLQSACYGNAMRLLGEPKSRQVFLGEK